MRCFLKNLLKYQLFILCVTLPIIGAEYRYLNSNTSLFSQARYTAVGQSFLAIGQSGGVTTNPANIYWQEKKELHLSYAGYYRNTFSVSNFDIVIPLPDNAGLGLSLNYLLVPDIENTQFLTKNGEHVNYDPEKIIYSSHSDLMVAGSYARGLFESLESVNLAVGGRLEVIRRRLLQKYGYGLIFDLGTTLELVQSGLRFSILAKDLFTRMLWIDGERATYEKPHVYLGLSYLKTIPYIYGTFAVSFKSLDVLGNDGVHLDVSDESNNVTVYEGKKADNSVFTWLIKTNNLGLEYIIRDIVSLRIGLNKGDFAFGAGLSLFDNKLPLDFAYSSSDLSGSYVVSLGYRW